MDEEGEKLEGDDTINLKIILDSFIQHYKPFQNVTYARYSRYKLFSHKQKDDQTISNNVKGSDKVMQTKNIG